MKKLLAHVKTKAEFTEYLASKTCQNATFITERGEHLRKIALACKEIVSTSFELRFFFTRKGEVEARYSVNSAFVFTWARSFFIGLLRM